MKAIRRCSALLTSLLLPLFLLSTIWLGSLPISVAKAAEVRWTYGDSDGPDHWAELDSSFVACAAGQAQSPIDFTETAGTDFPDPTFHYESVPLDLLNDGHTIQLPYAPGSYMTLDGKVYNLLQLHFHSPSEHTIDAQQSDAELHLVHQSDDGELAVVAVLLQPGDDTANDAYPLSTELPQKAGDKIKTRKAINALTLLPEQTTTYRYSGSLTTPPCTESVNWLVMTEPVAIAPTQLSEYKKLLNNNNRPLQRLNSRTVQLDISSN